MNTIDIGVRVRAFLFNDLRDIYLICSRLWSAFHFISIKFCFGQLKPVKVFFLYTFNGFSSCVVYFGWAENQSEWENKREGESETKYDTLLRNRFATQSDWRSPLLMMKQLLLLLLLFFSSSFFSFQFRF